MKRAVAVVALSSVFACAAFGDDDIASLLVVRGIFRSLLSMARYGFGPSEEAAFIIRTRNGIAFLHWPTSGDRNGSLWEGPIPDGTIAIAHTHPAGVPMPSFIDARTSSVTGLPVYVITNAMISRTTGGRGEVVSARWNR